MATDIEPKTETVSSTESGEPLRSKVLAGVTWVVAGQLGMQAWRLASNLILARLLVPEAFGLIGLVHVFVMSLQLFSDIGLRGSVIHHRRGDCPGFLNTVWTVAVMRGLLLWSIACLVAYPLAWFYGMPQLRWLLPVAGFSAVFRGMASTSLLTASRHLRPRWYILVDSASQIIGTTATVVLALALRSVLALALGWVITAMAYMVLSYCHRDVGWNRWHWDREAARAIAGFGRWSVASSLFTVLQQRGDRLALGKIMAVGQLGTYVIGSNLALVPLTLFQKINLAVAQPTYAKLRNLPVAAARKKLRRLRLGLVVAHAPLLWLMVAFGQQIVDFFYPEQYTRAGWYCSLTSLAVLMRVGTDLGPIFPARGDARSHFTLTSVRSICLVAAMGVGFVLGHSLGNAVDGLIWGVILAPLVSYPYQARRYRQIHAWLPEVDALVIIPTLLLGLAMALSWL